MIAVGRFGGCGRTRKFKFERNWKMGIFGFFNKKCDSSAMPIGAALDMLENISKRFPFLVVEWVKANPSRAVCIDGLVDRNICKQYKQWDGPYSITLNRGKPFEQIYNFFFQDLRRDVKRLHEMVVSAGEAENETVSWILSMRYNLSEEQLASEVVKRGIKGDDSSALEYVRTVLNADSAGVFDDVHAGYQSESAAKDVGRLIADGLKQYTLMLTQEDSFTAFIDQLVCSIVEAKTLIAASLYAFCTTMLSTRDCCDRIVEFKEELYTYLNDDFPELRLEFNMMLEVYEQADHAVLEDMTRNVPHSEKMPAAFLMVVGMMLTGRLWGEDKLLEHKQFYWKYMDSAKDFYLWAKERV